MKWHVDPDKANQLNLRDNPKPGTVIVSLPAETNIIKLSEHPTQPIWWKVEADVNGTPVIGFVHSGYLKQGSVADVTPVVTGAIPVAHLRMAGKTRAMNGGRAFPLDEPGMPVRSQKTATELVSIIKYLNPGKTAHMRYQAGSGNTYCNIYAYDYAMRCGVYLPRVWWTNKALTDIASGGSPKVVYAKTVREIRANELHDWFIDYGHNFGWYRTFDATDLQTAANAGKVGIIVAKRVVTSRSGHIVAVVPEHDGILAAKTGNQVTRPVQSQAGSSNFTAKVSSTRWWAANKFQSFGFWICG